MTDYSNLTWRKSARSGEDNCVEVADLAGGMAVRDSKDPVGPLLTFSAEAWRDFVEYVKKQ